jgi:hypothetical protein
MKYKGYDIFVSDKPDKKYYAIVDGKRVYFGARAYEQYYDILGHYKSKNHLDKKRRDAYYSRHNKDYKQGSAGRFSKRVLWPKNK